MDRSAVKRVSASVHSIIRKNSFYKFVTVRMVSFVSLMHCLCDVSCASTGLLFLF